MPACLNGKWIAACPGSRPVITMNGVEQNWILALAAGLPLLAGLAGLCIRHARASWLAGILSLLASALAGASLWATGGGSFSIPWLRLPLLAALPSDTGEGWQMLSAPLALNAGQAQLLMLLTTALIGAGVLAFAWRERQGDPQAARFFAIMTLFAASMLAFTTADSLILLYIAWEGMGVCSYLLISYPGTAEARRAARQAFWTTRATDFGLLFAIIILQGMFSVTALRDIDLQAMLQAAATAGLAPATSQLWLGAAGLLLLLAVLGKAAQWPLSYWLPDAMVAPAPVSALLHAATLVAAGPLLLILVRQLFLAYEPTLVALTLAGGVTLLTGAAMALCQRDPKRVLAYSTVSQLGLVIMAVGVLAEEAALFHLIAHAWFKAALFLGVGFLVAHEAPGDHATAGDAGPGLLYELAGKAQRYPLLVWGVLVPAGLSLAGLPWLAGGLGKEQVLYALLYRAGTGPAPNMFIGQAFPLAAKWWVVGAALYLLAAPLTAAYITRLIGILTWRRMEPASPASLAGVTEQTGVARRITPLPAGWAWPLGVASGLAAVGSVGLLVFYHAWFATSAGFKVDSAAWKWSSGGHGVLVQLIAFACLALGAGLAWLLAVARPGSGRWLARETILAHFALYFRRGMFLREIFTTLIGRTGELLALLAGIAEISFIDWLALRCGVVGRALAVAANWFDHHIIDRVRWLICMLAWWAKALHSRTMQTGRIQRYMFVVLLGVAAMCLMILRPLGERVLEILRRAGALGGT
jgi:NADH:ubiquinone oxidoreductase subunit 5 (subunit L)/multisubunit Na+/H+ antiporter MnhA subunit